jgi:ABC-2 type transport system permease protein
MAASATATAQPVWQYFRAPQSVVRRFVARRTLRSATLWAFIFGIYTASKTLGFAAAAPTAAARDKLAASLGNNAGLNALLGTPHNINTVTGYAAWNTFSVIMIVGSIWAFMLATKYFRGEEEIGRSELLLAGQTTARRAAANTLAGLGISLVLQYVVVAVLYVAIGSLHTVGIGPRAALFFALAVTMGTILFMAVGALTSQLMPTRGRAASTAAIVFGVCFLIKASGDASQAHWLLDVTPLGWIERLRPLTGSQPIWLLPIFTLVLACAGAAIYLAGRRDLGDSVIADRDTARSRTGLLNSAFGASLRLTRGANLGWLAGIVLSGLFYGVLSKTAAQAIGNLTHGHERGSGKLFGGLEHRLQLSNEMLFLGVIFLIITPLAMCYAASAVGKIRDEEAQGYVDNFLVRTVSRQRWLGERTLLVALVSVIMCSLTGLGVWVGVASQHGGVAIHSLLLAGLNMLGAVIFTLGIGILAMGVIPRLTTVIAYSVVGWSFMMEILGSGLHLNHWLIDTSVLTHVTLAPAVSPDWTANAVLAGLGLACYAVGSLEFNRRDLASE